tara:strand:+ start:5602 stop:6129 length:528 start_codon:yes stop_codon:yes gene_type:complete
MENDYARRIEEEIRQYKLYKIQVVEAKVRGYKKAFHEIKENATIKFTKNASSNLLIIMFLLLAASILGLGVLFLFPEQTLGLWGENGGSLSMQVKFQDNFVGYILLAIALLLGFISSLLKKNIKKRNTIYNLSKLISDVIDTMDDHAKEDKRKYEYFVDSAAEIERRKKSNTYSF